jgi:hypothetical protein
VVDDSEYVTNNEFQNTTNIDGGEVTNNYEQNDNSNTSYQFGGATFGTGVNGTISGSNMMFVAHIEFTAMDLFPDYETIDYRNNTFSYNWTYYDYLTNSERTEVFDYSCNVFYLIGSLSNGSNYQVTFWEDDDYYWSAWDNEYNSTIADMLGNAGYNHSVRSICDENYIATMPIIDASDNYTYSFLTIDIPEGYAIQYLQLDAMHNYYGCGSYYLSYYRCSESQRHYQTGVEEYYTWSEGVIPSWTNRYYGGWDNITIDFDLKIITYGEYNGLNLPYSSEWHYEGVGLYSIWPSSTYEFTLYYQFVPVMPVE